METANRRSGRVLHKVFLLGSTFLLAILSTGVATASSEVVLWSGKCDELVFGAPLSADHIRKYVPDYFELRTTGNEDTVLFYISSVSCWDVKLGETPLAPFNEAFAGVEIQRPEACQRSEDEVRDGNGNPTGQTVTACEDANGSATNNHTYQLWSVHDSGPLHAALAPQGHPCPKAPCLGNLDFEGGLDPVVSTASVEVSWPYSGWHFVEVTSSPPTIDLSGDKDFAGNGGAWYLGPKGPVRRAFLLDPLRLQAGAATLTLERGSLLAEIVGGTTVPGAGLIADHHFVGKSEVAGW